MNNIHMVLQVNERIAKSIIALVIAQYFQNKSKLNCADNGPVNSTFTQYDSKKEIDFNSSPVVKF